MVKNAFVKEKNDNRGRNLNASTSTSTSTDKAKLVFSFGNSLNRFCFAINVSKEEKMNI